MDQLIKQLQLAAAAQAQVQTSPSHSHPRQHPHTASALQLYAAAAAVNLRVPGWSPFLSQLPIDSPNLGDSQGSGHQATSSSSVYMLRQMALMQRANAAAAAAAIQQQRDRNWNREMSNKDQDQQTIKSESLPYPKNVSSGRHPHDIREAICVDKCQEIEAITRPKAKNGDGENIKERGNAKRKSRKHVESSVLPLKLSSPPSKNQKSQKHPHTS
ncbi:uncharacterized protein OdsH isoform X3 [Drosophila takahashii]|uniref:uncharacterized protein OdsH isoform X3 n=1 Tax=Drosophila takahashii TaxID=29030 RepID=UPI00389955DA